MLLFKISLLLAFNVIQQDFTAETFTLAYPFEYRNYKLVRYKVNMISTKTCKVPYKRKNYEMNIVLKNMENGSQMCTGNYTILKNTMEQIIPKFTIWSLENNTEIRILRQPLPSICNCDFCIKKMYSRYLFIERVKSGCLVRKGTKMFEYDPDEFIHDMIGDWAVFRKFKVRLTYEAKLTSYGCLESILETNEL